METVVFSLSGPVPKHALLVSEPQYVSAAQGRDAKICYKSSLLRRKITHFFRLNPLLRGQYQCLPPGSKVYAETRSKICKCFVHFYLVLCIFLMVVVLLLPCFCVCEKLCQKEGGGK